MPKDEDHDLDTTYATDASSLAASPQREREKEKQAPVDTASQHVKVLRACFITGTDAEIAVVIEEGGLGRADALGINGGALELVGHALDAVDGAHLEASGSDYGRVRDTERMGWG
ncbi:hypothetical protein CSUB01_12333 [Colletotrichum sublineola]|uniref:Uncharacterized protein n=1 Tax=Colletotrichum sublineola TaxID=1173701 RepID=A0A066XM52_COLSU|nr:hypothetical protein CSUB01_12333 [Colletotrichum sublineola]